jgi:hypothetical protein
MVKQEGGHPRNTILRVDQYAPVCLRKKVETEQHSHFWSWLLLYSNYHKALSTAADCNR